jgi:hypothetical protein
MKLKTILALASLAAYGGLSAWLAPKLSAG